MKLMWLGNGPIRQVYELENKKIDSDIGWISSIIDDLLENYNVELVYVFPQTQSNKAMYGTKGKFTYYGLHHYGKNPWRRDKKFVKEASSLLVIEHPQILQIWGTEYAHSLDFFDAIYQNGLRNRTIVHLQGFVGFLGEKYLANLPRQTYMVGTFRDILRMDCIFQQKAKFLKRSKNEIELLKGVRYVAGRTSFDYAHVKQINPTLVYFSYNESMRASFFNYNWSYEGCEKNTIFLTQGYYPVKGLHFLIKSLGYLKKNGKTIKVYVAGENILHTGFAKIRDSSYAKYLRKLMEQYDVTDEFVFLGYLNSETMGEYLTRANLFIVPSVVENSPNSLAEALIVGTPVISSYVGGIPDMVQNGSEAYLYPYDDEILLASLIEKLLGNKDECIRLSDNARRRARIMYAASSNNKELMKIYNYMIEKDKTK